jgi:hypothetical protein
MCTYIELAEELDDALEQRNLLSTRMSQSKTLKHDFPLPPPFAVDGRGECAGMGPPPSLTSAFAASRYMRDQSTCAPSIRSAALCGSSSCGVGKRGGAMGACLGVGDLGGGIFRGEPTHREGRSELEYERQRDR